MKNAVSSPSVSIGYASKEDKKCVSGTIAFDSSSTLMGWRELFTQESPSDLSTTYGDEFPDDPFLFDNGPGLQTTSSSESSVQPEALGWAPFFQDYRHLSQVLQRTSMSTALPYVQHQYGVDMEEGARGRRLPPVPPNELTGRSRSTPRRPQVAPTQIRRVASTHNLTNSRPFPLLDITLDSTTGGAVPLFTSGSFSNAELDPLARGSDVYRYGNVDHDHAPGGPDRTHTSLSPNDKNGEGGKVFVSASSSSFSSWVLPGRDHGSASPHESPKMDNFLTGGDVRLHPSSSYYDLSLLPQPSFEFPEPHKVSTIGSESVIDPSSASTGSGVGDNRPLSLTTADTATSQESITRQSQNMSSVNLRKFRSTVGSKAMVEACKKRRKQGDGVARLFVCEIPSCGRNFTARHNLRYHMKSHNDIRDEICRDCGSGFVTRETRRRHQKTCNGYGITKRSRN